LVAVWAGATAGQANIPATARAAQDPILPLV
jgi:hypothetical protein